IYFIQENISFFLFNSFSKTFNLNMSKKSSHRKVDLLDFKPPFPPTLTINDLTKNVFSSGNKQKMVPNAFIAYRMALIKEFSIKNSNLKLPRMSDFSRIAEKSWNKEPKYVKSF